LTTYLFAMDLFDLDAADVASALRSARRDHLD